MLGVTSKCWNRVVRQELRKLTFLMVLFELKYAQVASRCSKNEPKPPSLPLSRKVSSRREARPDPGTEEMSRS